MIMVDDTTFTNPASALSPHDRLRSVLEAAGLSATPGAHDSDIHSWRCRFPEPDVHCTCLADLVDDLVTALVPEHRILVSFAAVTDHESGDWELGLPGYDYTDLADPEVVAHTLDDGELARMYYQIESMGTLGESDAYHHLDKAIETIAEPAAVAEREEAEARKMRPLFEL